MKISALVTALLASSLCAGAAMAAPRTSSMPRSLELRRVHGDTVDRAERRADRQVRAERTVRSERTAPAQVQHGRERLRCADTGADCASRATVYHRLEAREAARGSAASARTTLNAKAQSRMNCSDSGECTASSKATKASKASSVGTAKGAASARSAVEPTAIVPRQLGQRQSPRMACNEAEECSMSSKDARKYWAMQSYLSGSKSSNQIATAERARRAAEERARNEATKRRTAKHD